MASKNDNANDIHSRRLAGTLGLEVTNIDLAKPVSDKLLARLKKYLEDYQVLVFPNQGHLKPEDHIAFAGLWGPLHIMPAGHVPGHRELIKIESRGGKVQSTNREAAELHDSARLARTDIWHSDFSFEETPPLGSLLLAREIPEYGGDTMFASQYAAYEALSPAMQNLLAGMRALHCGEGYYRIMGLDPGDAPKQLQPVVRSHPVTGRKALYVNRIWTKHFEGMTVEESQPLLNFLYEQAARPNFTFRHRWSPGDLVFWDNRFVQHYAINDYGSQTRIMHRATVLGEKPL